MEGGYITASTTCLTIIKTLKLNICIYNDKYELTEHYV